MINLSEFWKYKHRINWKSSDFSIEKAYVCSLFSKLAYLHIPEFELQSSDRIKIIPCEEYSTYKIGKGEQTVSQILRQTDLGNFFILNTRFAVILGISAYGAIIIAIRGTVPFYLSDWKTDLNFKKWYLKKNHFFHKGFFYALMPCIVELQNKLQQFDSRLPIYVTGHSLGGALSAVLRAINHPSIYQYFPEIHSCYTFGMPRYTNLNTIKMVPNPYHIYHMLDVVPALPPKLFGYANSLDEYLLSKNSITKTIHRKKMNLLQFLNKTILGKGILDHFIEKYIISFENILK